MEKRRCLFLGVSLYFLVLCGCERCEDSRGQIHTNGAWYYEDENECQLNQCVDGREEVMKQYCITKESNNDNEIIPDELLSKNCSHKNITYKHDETWGNKCKLYICYNGEIIEKKPKCAPPPETQCAEIEMSKNDCCTGWQCQDTKYHSSCKHDGHISVCFQPNNNTKRSCQISKRQSAHNCCKVFKCEKDCELDNGDYKAHGKTWNESCEIHICNDGVIEKELIMCDNATNPECRLVESEQCCPVYDCECQTQNRMYKNQQRWTSDCKHHHCDNGRIVSEQIKCPDVYLPNCIPRHTPGVCCPLYDCNCTGIECQAPTSPMCEVKGKTEDKCCDVYSCPYDCTDEKNRVHRAASIWHVDCKKYQCLNGTIKELFDRCPKPPPDRKCIPVYKNGICCPIYNCELDSCVVGTKSFDGCNHCDCLMPGVLICSQHNCKKLECTDNNNVTQQHNAVWVNEMNRCNNFTCQYGKIITKHIACKPKPNKNCVTIRSKDQCCPEWNCSKLKCSSGHNSTWLHECNTCNCVNGVARCTENFCLKDCVVDGKRFKSGSRVLSEGTCYENVCVDGIIYNNTKYCQIPPFDDCVVYNENDRFQDNKQCCPVWKCKHVPGWRSPCRTGEIYVPEKEECLICQCVRNNNTNMALCTKRECTNQECEYGGKYFADGEKWKTNDPCEEMSCVNGRVHKFQLTCPDASEIDDKCYPFTESGKCCPVYTCSDVCEHKETWIKGCGTCFCRNNVTVCTNTACKGCETNDAWKQKCNTCICKDGDAICTNRSCTDNIKYHKIEYRMKQTCEEDDAWTDGCNTCICKNSQPFCTSKQCTNETEYSSECVDGQQIVTKCNICTCMNGIMGCSVYPCIKGPQSSTCPPAGGRKVWPHMHVNATACYSSHECAADQHYVRCCDHVCTAVDHKPGKCVTEEQTAGGCADSDYAREGDNRCDSDHQCPGTFKCCDTDGCGRMCREIAAPPVY